MKRGDEALLDVALLALGAWCAWWVATAGRRRALLFGAGLAVATYVAVMGDGWVARMFAPPSNPVMNWIQQHVDVTEALNSWWFPPLPAAAVSLPLVQWTALQILRALVFTGILIAVLMLFVVMAYLRDALWDAPEAHGVDAVSLCIGFTSAGWLTAVSAWLLARLAWLHPLAPLASTVASSLWVHAVLTLVDSFVHMTGVL